MFAATSTPQLSSHHHMGSILFQRSTEVEMIRQKSVLNGGWGTAFPLVFQEGVDGIL